MDCQPADSSRWRAGAVGFDVAYGERRLRIRFAVGGIAVLVATMWAPSVHAARTAPAPLAVQSASLTQSGQDVVWSVQLATPFSPGALAPDGRSLCLLTEQVRDSVETGQVCLIGPACGRRPRRGCSTGRSSARARAGTRLGPPSIVTATVTRAGSRQLTATFRPSAIGIGIRPGALAGPEHAGAAALHHATRRARA